MAPTIGPLTKPASMMATMVVILTHSKRGVCRSVCILGFNCTNTVFCVIIVSATSAATRRSPSAATILVSFM